MGRKKAIKGSKRGLSLVTSWRARPGPVFLVEGPSDTLALTAAGLAAVGRPSNTGGARLLAELLKDWPADRCIVVVGENDEKPDGSWPGRDGAERTAGVLASQLGRVVLIAYPPDRAKDVRAWLTERSAGGADWSQLGNESLAALESQPFTPAERSTQSPVIRISTKEYGVNDEAADSLRRETDLYRRGGALVRVTDDPPPVVHTIRRPAGPRIEPVTPAGLRERLTRCAEFRKVVERNGEIQELPAHPPVWCVNAVHGRGCWPAVRPLEAVVDHPVLTPDGAILSQPGYDSRTGIMYRSPNPLDLPVPEIPTAAAARAAAYRLLEIVADFPFAADAHRAAYLAALLTPLARFAFPGPAPLFLIDTNTRGSGKGLLADTIAHVVTGSGFTICDYTNDRDELRKRITSLAVQGDRLVLFDNLDGAFGNGTLDAALTGSNWQDRLLGTNIVVRVPLFVTWYATGNNVAVGADTIRRVCHIRLESPMERPDQRTGFRHSDLLAWVVENRPTLLTAALTILRGWFAAGRPVMGLTPWGSFTGWSGVVRNAVVWAGLPDPADTRGLLQDQSDTVAETMAGVLAGIEGMDPDRKGVTAGEIIERVYKNPPAGCAWLPGLRSALDALLPRADARALGYRLRSYRRRIFGGRFLDRTGDGEHGVRWTVLAGGDFHRSRPAEPEQTPPPDDPGDADDVPRGFENWRDQMLPD